MKHIEAHHRSTILVALILIGAISGSFIPEFYDWTGADQSRPSPLMWQVPLGLSVIALLFCALLPWMPIQPWSEGTPRRTLQFNVRSLLAFTAVAAVLLAIEMKYPVGGATGCYVLALIAALASAVLHREWRLPIAALLASQLMPFIWVFGYWGAGGLFPSILWVIPSMPGLLPTALFVHLLGWNLHEGGWIAISATAMQIVIVLGMIRLGPRRAIACILFVLLSSLVSSLGLHALYRA